MPVLKYCKLCDNKGTFWINSEHNNDWMPCTCKYGLTKVFPELENLTGYQYFMKYGLTREQVYEHPLFLEVMYKLS